MAGQGREDKYCFSHDGSSIQTHHLVDQLQTFQQSTSEIYTTLVAAAAAAAAATSVDHDHHVDKSNSLWKGLFFSGVHGGTAHPSSSKPEFYHHHEALHMVVAPDHDVVVDQNEEEEEEDDDDDEDGDENSNSGAAIILPNWQHHVVFPCEGNERPSQGLSLSLSSTNPSTIGLQSFELRPQQQQQQQQQQDLIRFVPSDHDHEHDQSFFPKPMNNNNNNNGTSTLLIHDQHHHGQFDQIRNSKYLIPAQDLLNEFCNLGTNQQISVDPKTLRTTFKPHKDIDHHHHHHAFCNSNKPNSSSTLYSLDLLHLHKRKSKLLSILEQLDRRYRHYCDQMKAVVSSFESVAGNGAAEVYSRMASKAMSKHFRCLRDGIVGQIKATKKAMGEKDIAAPGTTRGETPRLRILDQNLRQQKAFQQMTLMETHPWRPQRGLPERSVSVLRAWLFEHFLHPYPSDVDKHILARQTGLSRSQVSNWFINARVRLWKPMVEEMYTEELREAQLEAKPGPEGVDDDYNINRKPVASGQLTRIDSECLSSVINNNNNSNNNNNNNSGELLGKNQMSFGGNAFGAVELDFSTYAAAAGGNGGGGGGGGGGVSLTLELQQHGGGGNGVSLAFSPAAGQSSLFYNSREQMEDCQPVQYLLEGDDDQGQNLPYRFLMGAQLLNDLAG